MILTGALGLWLLGLEPPGSESPPVTPAIVSFAPEQVLPSTVDVSAPALSQGLSLGDLSHPAAVPEQDAGDAELADAPAYEVDAPSAGLAAPSEDAGPQDAGSQDVGSQDSPPQGAGSQDVATQDAPPQGAGSQDAASQDAGLQDVGPQGDALPDAVPQGETPRSEPVQGAAAADAAAPGAAPQDAPGQDAPVQAGGEALPLGALAEMSPGLTAQDVAGILPGLFASILPTPSPSPVAPASPETTARWVWPVRGELSQAYSSGHRAIDISTDQGAVVCAADAGTVVYARWESTGYGYLVIVDHHDGFVSYYAHLYGFYIDVGHEVARGEQIGELGTTGRSTGPHLHFEIRQDGVQRDPLDLLP